MDIDTNDEVGYLSLYLHPGKARVWAATKDNKSNGLRQTMEQLF